MRKILIILMIIAFALSACNKIGPFPSKQQDICMLLDLKPTCEEWVDYCFETYFVMDEEDGEFIKVLVECGG